MYSLLNGHVEDKPHFQTLTRRAEAKNLMVPMADCFCLDAHVACEAGLEASRNGDLI